MKANETASSTANSVQSHGGTFAKVFDGRKQPIRGLWIRNGRYYAQLAVEDPTNGTKRVKRVPLVDRDGNAVTTQAQSVEALNRLRTKRADDDLPTLGRTPKFSRYADDYLNFIKTGEGM